MGCPLNMEASLSNEFRSATGGQKTDLVMYKALDEVKQPSLVKYGENCCALRFH